MALYFYFNETTGDLVYSDQATYSDSGYTNLGQQTNTNPNAANNWVFHSQRANIKTVTKDPNISGQIHALTNTGYMFFNCTALTSLDLSGFDTSNATSMSFMFANCSALTSLDLSGFDTSSVTNMSYMFVNCTALTSLDLSGFDTSSVTIMDCLFYNCTALTSLDLSGFDTSSVTNTGYMFFNCTALTSLDLSGFDTSNTTNMDCMFFNCNALTSLDLSGFNTSSVTDLMTASLFADCNSLRIVDISPNMSNILSELPVATYYDAVTRQSYAKADIPGGSTYVRNLADLDPVSTMIQNRQAVRSLRHIVNKLSKRVVALETSVASLKQ